MLGNAADAFSFGEVYARFRPWRPHHFAIDCSCGANPCSVWQGMEEVPERRFHAVLMEKQQVDFVIDSSKDLCWVIDAHDWAAANGIKIFNILIWKDPVELAYSFWKRGSGLTGWRRVFLSYHTKLFQVGLPFLAVSYAQLVRDPKARLADICGATGIPYFEGKERFWEKEHHYLFGSGGVRRQVESGSSRITARTAFPAEFEVHTESLRQQVDADVHVQQVLEVLRQADVSEIAGDGIVDHRFTPKKPFPWWYYVLRAARAIQRHFPERYEGMTPGQTATVRAPRKLSDRP